VGKLVPPDLNQCQAEKPIDYSFMTLGGRPGFERCIYKPTWIAIEKKPGPDNLIGSMSLCDECKCKLIEQAGDDYCTFQSI
jgi:hypothetical protein